MVKSLQQPSTEPYFSVGNPDKLPRIVRFSGLSSVTEWSIVSSAVDAVERFLHEALCDELYDRMRPVDGERLQLKFTAEGTVYVFAQWRPEGYDHDVVLKWDTDFSLNGSKPRLLELRDNKEVEYKIHKPQTQGEHTVEYNK